jgi:23S rRNA pseudouridine1911/1915/1917 synthase
VAEFLKTRDKKPGNVFVGLAHRLDQPVTGVMVLAKTSKALDRLNRSFHDRTVEKTYLAITSGMPYPEAGTLKHYLWKDQSRNYTVAHTAMRPGRKEAVLSYRLLASKDGMGLVEVSPQTGRPHQIRVQLATIGCPIIGDLRYGKPPPLPDKSIALHAWRLRLMHPVQKTPLELKAPLPDLEVWKKWVEHTL